MHGHKTGVDRQLIDNFILYVQRAGPLFLSFDSPAQPRKLIQDGSVMLLAVSENSENSESGNEVSVSVEPLLMGPSMADGKLVSELGDSTGEPAHERRQLCYLLRHAVSASAHWLGNGGLETHLGIRDLQSLMSSTSSDDREVTYQIWKRLNQGPHAVEVYLRLEGVCRRPRQLT